MSTPDRASTASAYPMPRTRTVAVADELRRLIHSGEIPPGARLRQADIASRLGVSTTPVREAFSALAREGLVRQDAQRGATVFVPSPAELQENFEIRLALEPLATGLAAERLTAGQLAALERLVAEMGHETDPARYHDLDRAFHADIYRASDRPRLIELVDALRDVAQRASAGAEHQIARRAEAQREHEAILAALAEHAAEHAAALMADHLRASAPPVVADDA